MRGGGLTEDDYKQLLRKLIADPEMEAFVKDVLLNRPLVFESVDGSNKLDISPNAVVNNALFNLSSGNVRIEDWVFFGHGVRLLTGSHDASKRDRERQHAIPQQGRDIVVKQGAWICSGATIIGPCTVGEHSVVAAASLVNRDVPPFTMVGGVPAKVIKRLDKDGGTT